MKNKFFVLAIFVSASLCTAANASDSNDNPVYSVGSYSFLFKKNNSINFSLIQSLKDNGYDILPATNKPNNPDVWIIGGLVYLKSKNGNTVKPVDLQYLMIGNGIISERLNYQGSTILKESIPFSSVSDDSSVHSLFNIIDNYNNKAVLQYTINYSKDGLSIDYGSVNAIPKGYSILDVRNFNAQKLVTLINVNQID